MNVSSCKISQPISMLWMTMTEPNYHWKVYLYSFHSSAGNSLNGLSVICTDQIGLPAEPTTEITAILCTHSSIYKPIALAGLDHCGVAIFPSRCQKAQDFFFFFCSWKLGNVIL